MTYKAVFTDEFLSHFRLDDNGKTLVITDKTGLTRAVRLEAEKHGEWKHNKNNSVIKCSECGFGIMDSTFVWFRNYCGTIEDNPLNFCPNCGADMREDTDDAREGD